MAKKTSDSRKQVWKFQEGAVVLALREATNKPVNVHWHHTPRGMSIDPDVVVGADPDLPKTVVFVTHASAEMAGQKKFWRTIAEMIEAKRLKSHPLLLSIMFPGNVKKALKDVYSRAFEVCIHIDEAPYAQKFNSLVESMTTTHGTKSEEACLKHLENLVASAACTWWGQFVKDIKKALKVTHGTKHLLMCSNSFSHREHIPSARSTSLRRSICKLFTLPGAVRDHVLNGDALESVPLHALILGWFQEGIEGCELIDQELYKFCRENDRVLIEKLCDHALTTQPVFSSYARNLQQIASARICNDWIVANLEELSSASGMKDALNRIYSDSLTPLKQISDVEICIEYHWLFQSLMAALRAETGRSDGYGYSVLGKETGHEYEINAFAGTVIAPYLQRKKTLPEDLLTDISNVFSGHVKRIGGESMKALLLGSVSGQCESTFNFQMMNYRFFNPVDWLVVLRLNESSIPNAWPATHRSFLNTSGGEIASSTGNLISIAGERIWIKCQSAYDGKIDKRKELCGRVGAMKLCYSAKELKSVRFYLVIDGHFDDGDIKLLSDSGWDGIFYYDQLDELMRLIKNHSVE